MIVKDGKCSYPQYKNLILGNPVASWASISQKNIPPGKYHIEWKMRFAFIPEGVSTSDTKKGIGFYNANEGSLGGIIYKETEYGKTYSFTGDIDITQPSILYAYTCLNTYNQEKGKAIFYDVLLKNLDTGEIILKSPKSYLTADSNKLMEEMN